MFLWDTHISNLGHSVWHSRRHLALTSSLWAAPDARSKGTFPLTRSGSGAVTEVRSGFLGLQCFHVVCFHYGGADAGWKRVSAAGPHEWVLELFFRPAPRSGSGLETIGLKSFEVSKLCYWYQRCSDRSDIGQVDPLFKISEKLRIRHFNSSLNKASTGRAVMLMKTKLCSGMKFFCIIMSDVAFNIGKSDSLNIDYSCGSVCWITMVCLLMVIFLHLWLKIVVK